ncbi:MAG: hypothetical protein HON55_01105 [Legionellales bacterium]|jgi:hypothetical protein|nr:hypothetical protein [Legionellales bacterium]
MYEHEKKQLQQILKKEELSSDFFCILYLLHEIESGLECSSLCSAYSGIFSYLRSILAQLEYLAIVELFFARIDSAAGQDACLSYLLFLLQGKDTVAAEQILLVLKTKQVGIPYYKNLTDRSFDEYSKCLKRSDGADYLNLMPYYIDNLIIDYFVENRVSSLKDIFALISKIDDSILRQKYIDEFFSLFMENIFSLHYGDIANKFDFLEAVIRFIGNGSKLFSTEQVQKSLGQLFYFLEQQHEEPNNFDYVKFKSVILTLKLYEGQFSNKYSILMHYLSNFLHYGLKDLAGFTQPDYEGYFQSVMVPYSHFWHFLLIKHPYEKPFVLQQGFKVWFEFLLSGTYSDKCRYFPFSNTLFSYDSKNQAVIADDKLSETVLSIQKVFISQITTVAQLSIVLDDKLELSENMKKYFLCLDQLFKGYCSLSRVGAEDFGSRKEKKDFFVMVFNYFSIFYQDDTKIESSSMHEFILNSTMAVLDIMGRLGFYYPDISTDLKFDFLAIFKAKFTSDILSCKDDDLWFKMSQVLVCLLKNKRTYDYFDFDLVFPSPDYTEQFFFEMDSCKFTKYLQFILNIAHSVGRREDAQNKIHSVFFPLALSRFESGQLDDASCLKIFYLLKVLSMNRGDGKDLAEMSVYDGVNNQHYKEFSAKINPELWVRLGDKVVPDDVIRNSVNLARAIFKIADLDSKLYSVNIPKMFELVVSRNMADNFISILSLAVLSFRSILIKTKLSNSDEDFIRSIVTTTNYSDGSYRLLGYDLLEGPGESILSDANFIDAGLDAITNIFDVIYSLPKSKHLNVEVKKTLVVLFNMFNSMLSSRYGFMIERLASTPVVRHNMLSEAPRSVAVLLKSQLLPRKLHYKLADFFGQYIVLHSGLRTYKFPFFGDVTSAAGSFCEYYKLVFDEREQDILFCISKDGNDWYCCYLSAILADKNFNKYFLPYKVMLAEISKCTNMAVLLFQKEGWRFGDQLSRVPLIRLTHEHVFPVVPVDDVEKTFLQVCYGDAAKKQKYLAKFWSDFLNLSYKLEDTDNVFLLDFLPREDIGNESLVKSLVLFQEHALSDITSDGLTSKAIMSFMNVRPILLADQIESITAFMFGVPIVAENVFAVIIRDIFIGRECSSIGRLLIQLADVACGDKLKDPNLNYFIKLSQEGFLAADAKDFFEFLVAEFTTAKIANYSSNAMRFSRVSDFLPWALKDKERFFDLMKAVDEIGRYKSSLTLENIKNSLLFKSLVRNIESEPCLENKLIFWSLVILGCERCVGNDAQDFVSIYGPLFDEFFSAKTSVFVGDGSMHVVSSSYESVAVSYSVEGKVTAMISSLKRLKDSFVCRLNKEEAALKRCESILSDFKRENSITTSQLLDLRLSNPACFENILGHILNLESISLSLLYKLWSFLETNQCYFGDEKLYAPCLEMLAKKKAEFLSEIATLDDVRVVSEDKELFNDMLIYFFGFTSFDFFNGWEFPVIFWQNSADVDKLEFCIDCYINFDLGTEFKENLRPKISELFLDIYGLELQKIKNDYASEFIFKGDFSLEFQKGSGEVAEKLNKLPDSFGIHLHGIYEKAAISSFVDFELDSANAVIAPTKVLKSLCPEITSQKIPLVKFSDAVLELGLVLNNIKQRPLLKAVSLVDKVYFELFTDLLSVYDSLDIGGVLAWILENAVAKTGDDWPRYLSEQHRITTVTFCKDFDDFSSSPFKGILEKRGFYRCSSGAAKCIYFRNDSGLGVRIKSANDSLDYLSSAKVVYRLPSIGVLPCQSDTTGFFTGKLADVQSHVGSNMPWSLFRLCKWVRRVYCETAASVFARISQQLNLPHLCDLYVSSLPASQIGFVRQQFESGMSSRDFAVFSSAIDLPSRKEGSCAVEGIKTPGGN